MSNLNNICILILLTISISIWLSCRLTPMSYHLVIRVRWQNSKIQMYGGYKFENKKKEFGIKRSSIFQNI